MPTSFKPAPCLSTDVLNWLSDYEARLYVIKQARMVGSRRHWGQCSSDTAASRVAWRHDKWRSSCPLQRPTIVLNNSARSTVSAAIELKPRAGKPAAFLFDGMCYKSESELKLFVFDQLIRFQYTTWFPVLQFNAYLSRYNAVWPPK